MNLKRTLALLLLLVPLSVSFAEDRPLSVEKVDPARVPFAKDDLDRASLRTAIRENRRVLLAAGERERSIGGVPVTRADLLGTLELVESLLDKPADEFAAAIASSLTCYRSVGSDGKGTVLFTGYHSPCYEGSRTRTDKCRWPLRRKPAEAVKHSRKEIEGEGKLDGQGLEVAWFARRLDAYLMEVQGSGSIRCPDGSVMRLQCSGTNGQPYVSLGKELVKDGKLTKEEASIPAIRQFFDAHPDLMDEYLFRNPSYVFFEESHEAPKGCTGAHVTPGRSIATDKRVFTGGALAFIVVEMPVCEGGKVVRWEKRARFVLDDDTGGAIRGPGRVDIYMGDDENADQAAGVMKREGELFYLVRRAD